MTSYGSARVSTGDQRLSPQEADLREVVRQVIRSEKKMGIQRRGRTKLDLLLRCLRRDDTLASLRIDRLARSHKDFLRIVDEMKSEGVKIMTIKQPVTTSAASKALLDMLGVFDEFRTNLGRERQSKAVAAPRRRRVYTGHNSSIDPAEVRHLYSEETVSPSPSGSQSQGRRRPSPCRTAAHRRNRP